MSTDVHCRSLQDINHSTSSSDSWPAEWIFYDILAAMNDAELTDISGIFMDFPSVFRALGKLQMDLILRKASDSHFRCCGDRGGSEIQSFLPFFMQVEFMP